MNEREPSLTVLFFTSLLMAVIGFSIMFVILLWTTPAISSPVTFTFDGEMGGGAVTGSFTYETVQNPTAFNVRGLQDNATYQLSSWNMTTPALTSWAMSLPAATFTTANSTVEFCEGKCIFGSGSQWYTNLRFTTGTTVLQLSFLLADPTPLSNPPTANEWGGFSTVASKLTTTTDSIIGVATIGGLASVPEPPTLWLFLIPTVVALLLSWAESHACGNGHRIQS